MQQLWRHKLGWDDRLPDLLFSQWQRIYSGLSYLDGLHIPRWTGYGSNILRAELHGFADASNSAYSAVVYLKIIDRENQAKITILTGKSKVAPLKPLSVPRLELSAAVLLTRCIEYVRCSLKFKDMLCYCWTDSTVVLTWLSHHPSRWKTFVANRVADIQSRLQNVSWRHVPTHDNPADCASRGLYGTEISEHLLWWHGPSWLSLSNNEWPMNSIKVGSEAPLEEKIISHHTSNTPVKWDLLSKYSSWPKLIRITAYVLRFISFCRHRTVKPQESLPRGLALTSVECSQARSVLIKKVQSELFSTDIHALLNHQELPVKSAILALRPFLDRDNVLRVGGRIARAPLPFHTRHPILLSSHQTTKLIIEQAHKRSLHAGVQLTLSTLRRDFWIIRARSLVRECIHHCVDCVRERATVPKQLMGNLPTLRVSAPTRGFLNCGLDYAGPISVRASAGRGIIARKAYIALFVCLATRAIHLELVGDYSAQAFLNAFTRFSSRRGLPQAIYSDNGTTFVGADRELTVAYRAALRDPNFQNATATDGVSWHFIPPAAPHFGGLWEAGVKSVKHHLRRMLKNHKLTYEEFTTLLCKIEACLNSRPIAPLSDTLDDYEPLTPGHFLIGSAITTNPEPSLFNVNENRLTRWQLVRHLTERFWKLWYDDYVNMLQQRSKWRTIQPSIRTGQLVLVRNSALPPCKWELARVIQCHPGSDGFIRVVTVKTANSEYKRPITKLCILPVETEM